MSRVEKKLKLSDEKFKRRIGTTRACSYQGILEYHEWSLIPIKKRKNQELSAAEKGYNRELFRWRRHLLCTRLVCAILNAEKA